MLMSFTASRTPASFLLEPANASPCVVCAGGWSLAAVGKRHESTADQYACRRDQDAYGSYKYA